VIGVAVATFGDKEIWEPLANRAVAAAAEQTRKPDMIVWRHGATLRDARNHAAYELTRAGCKWLLFCDGDDEFSRGYIHAMLAATARGGTNAIYRPNTIGVHEDGTTDRAPSMIPRTDMKRANCCVIGTMVRAEAFSAVGGFDDYPCLEDWALFRKLLARGAELVDVPDAVYRVHVRADSRNAPSPLMNATYKRIRKEIPL
jgi:hypothetical protein